MCPCCGGKRTDTAIHCLTCRAMIESRRKELKAAPQVERWENAPLNGTRMEKLFAFIVRGGKISPKGATHV